MKRKSLTCLICLGVAGMITNSPIAPAASPTTQPAETVQQRDERMAWWRDARFGMFIHWGIYSVPAGVYHGEQVKKGPGEWIMLQAKIPVAEYAKFADQFDAKDFDADRWVKLAKEAGMKYIVITAKHHDGFAMFHTAVDQYNVFDATPFHRDPIKELAEACKKQGIKFGIYYSQSQDWHHPGGGALHVEHWDPAQNGDFATYLKNVSEPQVKELLTKYGPIAEFWFDTATDKMTPELAAPFVEMLKKYQPQAIVNDRLGGGYKEDFDTPEQHVPPKGFPGQDWETCMTINDTWGYRSWSTNFKSSETLIHTLCEIASKGGNYLLNVGPDSHGDIPQPEVERLHAMGDWLKTNGDAIYGTTASPFPLAQPFGYVTKKPGKTFLEVFDWPSDQTLWLPIANADAVKKAYLLAAPDQSLKVETRDGGVAITVPKSAPDKTASVVVLEHDAPLQTFAQAVNVEPGKPITLDLSYGSAKNASFTTIKARTKTETISLDGNAQIMWKLRADTTADYVVTADLAATPKEAGTITLIAGSEKLSGTLTAIGGESAQAKTLSLGTLKLPAGTMEITVTAAPTAGAKAIHLHAIDLTPVK